MPTEKQLTMEEQFVDEAAHALGVSSMGDFGHQEGHGTPTGSDLGPQDVVFAAWCQDCPGGGVVGAKVGPPRKTAQEAQADADAHNSATGHHAAVM